MRIVLPFPSGQTVAGPGDDSRRALRCAVAGLALISLGACTEMPHTHGERARLFDGISKPRHRDDINITVHRYSITAWGKCLEMLADRRPLLAALSVLTISPIHACARLPRDKQLKPGQKPWCIVAVPDGEPETLEHEIRHCEGWNHPHPVKEPAEYAEHPAAQYEEN